MESQKKIIGCFVNHNYINDRWPYARCICPFLLSIIMVVAINDVPDLSIYFPFSVVLIGLLLSLLFIYATFKFRNKSITIIRANGVNFLCGVGEGDLEIKNLESFKVDEVKQRVTNGIKMLYYFKYDKYNIFHSFNYNEVKQYEKDVISSLSKKYHE